MVLGVSVADGDAVWSLCKAPYRRITEETFRIWIKALPSSTDNSSHFERQPLAWYGTSVETEHLTRAMKLP